MAKFVEESSIMHSSEEPCQLISEGSKSDSNRLNAAAQKADRLVKGSNNTLGICYLNALLQNLLAIGILRSYFIQSVGDTHGPLNVSLRNLFLETSFEHADNADITTTRGVMDAKPIFDTMCNRFPHTFKPYLGQTPLRFLLFMLYALSGEKELISRKPSSVVKNMFGIQVEETMSCFKLNRVTNVLRVPIDNAQVSITIESCLKAYMIGWDNHIIKSASKCLRKLFCFPPPIVKSDTKRINIITEARHIIIIKFPPKYSCKVEFTETLDFKPYMNPMCIDSDDIYLYGLVGTIVYCEPIEVTRHCVAYVKCTTSNTGHCDWYSCDDLVVQQVPVDRVLSYKPYMLFYERCRDNRM